MITADSWETSIIDSQNVRDLYPGDQSSMYTSQQAGTGDDYPTMSSDDWGAAGAGGVGPDGGGNNPEMAGGSMGAQNAPGGKMGKGGVASSPLTWVFILAVFAAGIMFTAHKTGKSEEFASIRASGYNIMLITLTAIVGILILKVIAGKVNVPGLSNALKAV
jgi:hypothetical protein